MQYIALFLLCSVLVNSSVPWPTPAPPSLFLFQVAVFIAAFHYVDIAINSCMSTEVPANRASCSSIAATRPGMISQLGIVIFGNPETVNLQLVGFSNTLAVFSKKSSELSNNFLHSRASLPPTESGALWLHHELCNPRIPFCTRAAFLSEATSLWILLPPSMIPTLSSPLHSQYGSPPPPLRTRWIGYAPTMLRGHGDWRYFFISSQPPVGISL